MVRSKQFSLGALASAVFIVAGCGGNGGPAPVTANPDTASGASISGTSYKGPTAGATICAWQIDNAAAGRKGAKVAAQAGSTASVADGCVVTANDGTYTFVLPAGVTGDLVLESTGGTYCSDESVFNGTGCTTGTPIAMGANALRTVVTPGANAVSAPLTLLTTAAVDQAANLSAASFTTAYETVAANFGLADKSPSASPDAGELKTALGQLAGYLGNDSALLGGVVESIASGALTGRASVVAGHALACQPLDSMDLTATLAMPGGIGIPGPGGIGGGAPVSIPMPFPAASMSACVASADGLTSKNVAYYFDNINGLFTANGAGGTYQETSYTGGCIGDRTSTGTRRTSFTMKVTGQQDIPKSATTDAAYSQSGVASKVTVTLAANDAFPQATTEQHLFCRTRQSSRVAPEFFQGYLTSPASPLRDGSRSRFDVRGQFTGSPDSLRL